MAAAALALLLLLAPAAQAWRVPRCAQLPKLAAGTCVKPMVTRWAKEVSPRSVRPEHPRPTARRARWRSLNGLWRLTVPTARWSPRDVLVPFTYEAPLSGIGRGEEAHERLSYTRTFRVPAAWRDERTFLHFGAVDWRASVYVNGRWVASHTGGYDPFSVDVTGALRPGDGPQRVTVRVEDPVDRRFGQPRGKQLGSEGIKYTRATGIWQTVWLEPRAAAHVASADLAPDLATGRLGVDARTTGAARTLEVRVLRDGAEVATKRIRVAQRRAAGSVAVPDRRPWSPEDPQLYDVELVLRDGDRVLDRMTTYTAFRTVRVAGERFELNGRPYELRGVLDQGYWPDGVYTPPSDAALRHDVATAKRLGFNTIRMHQKVEDPGFYRWADRLGVLVVQDMPASWSLATPAMQAQFETEWRAAVTRLRAHPSVVMWSVFNENWGRPSPEFQAHMAAVTRELDPTRPLDVASGWHDRGGGDVVDFHDYGSDLTAYGAAASAGRARIVGEYGGVRVRIPGHAWLPGPRPTRTPADLVTAFEQLTGQVRGQAGLSGYVYTQLFDVEQELNGLETYDRTPKAPAERFARANR